MHGEMRQVAHDVGIAKLARVTLVVKQNEVPCPVDVGILGTYAVVKIADTFAHLVEQAHRAQYRKRCGRSSRTKRNAGFHGGIVLYVYTV